ncbi:DUF5050 domain-containing protein [Myxococcota bacterium]|nr:DUF5050 domain-containing protein [Myxococcota bacterium]
MGESQRVGLLLILAFLLSCGSDSGSSGPDPVDPSELAVVSNRGGEPEIYVMNADGRNAVSVATNSASDYAPSWSPDGKKIAFTSYTQIVLEPQETCASGFVPNPDEPPPPEVHVMNADGSDQIRLTRIAPDSDSNCPTWSYGPSWSPDGSHIVFTSSRGDDVAEIYTMNADGSDETKITSATFLSSNEYPAWSPVGNQIAFSSVRVEQGSLTQQIYLINSDGTGLVRLTDNGANDARPAWSPNGDQIAFDSDRTGETQIYVMDNDGSNQTQITNCCAGDFYPAWSSDGERISFTSNRDGHSQVYVMSADGSDQKAVTSGDSWSSAASWKPEKP